MFFNYACVLFSGLTLLFVLDDAVATGSSAMDLDS